MNYHIYMMSRLYLRKHKMPLPSIKIYISKFSVGYLIASLIYLAISPNLLTKL